MRRPLGQIRLLLLLLFMIPVLLFGDYQYHTVKKGDTLYALGKKYGVSVDQIKRLNKMSSDNLSIGQKLRIKETPAPKPKPKPKPKPQPEQPPAINIAPPPAPAAVAELPAPQSQASEPTPEPVSLSSLPDEYYHTVQPGEGAYRISQNYNIKTEDFFRWNGKEKWDDFVIHPGDKLIIKDPSAYLAVQAAAHKPAEPKTPVQPQTEAKPDTVVIIKTYTVRPKDTLYSISKANSMTVDELKRLNNLSSNDIWVGQVLYLAGTPPAGGTQAQSPALTSANLESEEVIRTDLHSPCQGKVTSEFGIRNGKPHKGIDIAAKSGTPVYAVLDGVVVFSGAQGNYGNVVVVEHPDFVMTVYAHNERNLVSVNDTVKKGQQIALMGSTGNASGSHLHFEYRIKGKAINPRKVLSL